MSAVVTPATSPLRLGPVLRAAGRSVRAIFSGRTWRRTAHLLTGLFSGVVTFTAVITLLSVTFGTVVLFPVAVGFSVVLVAAGRVLGTAERYRARTFLDLDIASPHQVETGRYVWNRHWARLRRGSTWKELAYCLLQLPLGVLTWAATVVVWSVPITLVLLPLYVYALPGHRADVGLFTVKAGVAASGAALVGLVALLFIPAAIGIMAGFQGWVTRRLLGPSEREDLTARVAHLETSRSGVVDAAEAERRRIERDLHDGAQQRLVALAMDLGMAREKLATDPEQARQLLDEAHAEAKQALVELRNLARGIHPAVLTDRGLDAALSAVAARSPIPVDLTIDVSTRPGETVEGTAYFIVSEALANVAKHSQATRATVNVARRGTKLILEIADNGRGGADLSLGTGLAGLRDRVAGVDGWFHLSSPVGGPTTIIVELPCAS